MVQRDYVRWIHDALMDWYIRRAPCPNSHWSKNQWPKACASDAFVDFARVCLIACANKFESMLGRYVSRFLVLVHSCRVL